MEISIDLKTMTSKEISEITNKSHSNVMVDCRKLGVAYENLGQLKLQSSFYMSVQNKEQPMFILTKIQTMDLMTGYSIELRIKVNRRWEELENKNKLSLPQSYSEALRQLADTTEREDVALLQLEQANTTIKQNKPKVVFADSVSGCDNSILIRQFAKDLSDSNFKIGQNQLFEWMRSNKYINSSNEPYQQYINQGLFEVITRTIGNSTSNIQVKTTKVTGKGQIYFAEKLKANKNV